MQLTRLLALLALAWAGLVETAIYGQTPGLGWLIFFAASICGVGLLRVRLERAATSWTWLLWLLPLGCAYAMVCYDADLVQGLGPVLFMASWSVAVCWSLLPDSALDSFGRPLPGVWWLGWVAAPFAGCRELSRLSDTDDERSQRMRRMALGVLVSLPLLLLFTCLFASADAAYNHMLGRLGDYASGQTGASLLRIALLTACFMGFLARFALGDSEVTAPLQPTAAADATVMVGMLGSVNALFASFLAVQARYLFDARHAISLPGVTWAEYARQGFFELATVTVMVLLLVWVCYRVLWAAAGNTVAMALCVALILQTFGVAASALQRMHAYEVVFGLTLLRFYVTLAIGGMAVLLGLVLFAVARRRPPAWLAARIFLASWLLLSVTCLFDADGIVARVDVARPRCDMDYVSSLSLDALPYQAHAASAERLLRVEPGWPSYNLSRHAAQLRLSTTATGH